MLRKSDPQRDEYKKLLRDGIAKISGLDEIDDKKIDALLDYHQLLIKWNRSYNLTAVRNARDMIGRHLLDSLSIAALIKGDKFLDVGTGAGLPGLILAIVFPEKQFDLLDSNGKKTRFLFQVKTELQLHNVEIYQRRVEQHDSTAVYDGILSRAFATLLDMVRGSHHLLKESGCFYAMKGLFPKEEMEKLAELDKNFTVEHSHSLDVPGEEGQRFLIVIKADGGKNNSE